MADRLDVAENHLGRTRNGLANGYQRFVVALVMMAETGLMAAGGLGMMGSVRLLIVHLAVTGAMAVLFWRPVWSGSDGGAALLAVLGTLATGPFGAAGALLLPAFASRQAVSRERLAAWYRRIALSAEQDEFTQLSDRVAIGRTSDLSAPAPKALTELFRAGALAEQQAALGMIARAFHPGYLPALKIALESPEPVIRVQAAAVAARVRGQLKSSVDGLFTRAADPTLTAAEATTIAAELAAARDSGLLEENDRMRAAGIGAALLARTFARLDARQIAVRNGQPRAPEASSPEATDAYESHLLAEGRFDDYRAFRSRLRRPLTGRYRWRLVTLRPCNPALALALAEVRR